VNRQGLATPWFAKVVESVEFARWTAEAAIASRVSSSAKMLLRATVFSRAIVFALFHGTSADMD
jgi:hypothetical protein